MVKLSVIGLGKLGICTAVCFASKGYDVVGVDINEHYVAAINNGIAPLHEPRLQELLDQSKGRLRATLRYEDAIEHSTITFLIVPTPSLPSGHFSDQYLKDALKPLAEALKNKTGFHTFVITSTVSPGTINNVLIPCIEQHSGKSLHQGFGIAYNPEFIALGSVITDFLKPDMVLIGESEQRVGEELQKIYHRVCENKPYIARMSLISAEIAKISLNSYVTMKISFANTLANICGEIPAANVDDITTALGADKRISPYYLKGGLGFGGPCFPRDNRAFSAFAADFNVDAKLAKATDQINLNQHKRLFDYVYKICREHKVATVSVLGLAYKSNTPVIEESSSVKLIEQLLQAHMNVVVYDSLAMENARSAFGDRITYAQSVKECFMASPVCVFGTVDLGWASINHSYIVHHPTVIIDCWRYFHDAFFPKSVQLLRLGDKPLANAVSDASPYDLQDTACALC